MKKITKNFLLKSFLVLSPFLTYGQETDGIKLKRCSTVEYEAELKAKNPNRLSTSDFEKILAPHIEKFKVLKKNNRNLKQVYNIPVVIHIIHNGDDIGSGENITDAQAISQITVMNNDFRKLANTPGGANTTGLAVDCEINFVLAKQDPNGNPTTGVVRHTITPYTNNVTDGTSGADWEKRDDVEAMKKNTIWDSTRYLNMWTIRPGAAINDLLGYAQFPSNSTLSGFEANEGEANTDGVVARFDAFGSNDSNDGSFMLNPMYNLGRTMTHEVGHWLGLRHIWGDDECPTTDLTNNNSNEDFCADTPAAGEPNYECTAGTDSCTNVPGQDMIQNYMDYTPDSCMDTFTNDQKTRMQTVMQVADRRGSLNNSTVATLNKSGIYFTPEKNTYTHKEGKNCGFTDVTYKVSIQRAPSAKADITFNVIAQGTTAIEGKDFDFMSSKNVSFNTGSTVNQQLTIRFYNDANLGDKILKIGMSLNSNGGDAALLGAYTNSDSPSVLTCHLKNGTTTLSNTVENIIYSQNFDQAQPATIKTDRDGDTFNWEIYPSFDFSYGVGFSGNWLGSLSWDPETETALNPDNLITLDAPIQIPNTGSTKLNYNIAAADSKFFSERYALYITTSKNVNTIINTNPAKLETLSSGGLKLAKEIDLSAYAGQTVYLSFRHFETTDQFILMVDDIKVTNTVPTSGTIIQTTINSSTKFLSTINQSGVLLAKDSATDKVMAELTNNSDFNYGCTAVYVNRDQTSAGAAAVNYGSNTANNAKVMAKTFIITPTNNNASGNEKVSFYFTEAEIAAWETATGNSRNNLRIIKDGVNSSIVATLGSLGNNITLTGNVTNGFNGTYYFGTSNTLNSKEEEFESFTIYPNPSEGNFTVQLTSHEATIDIKVNDISGREIFKKNFENGGIFNQTIQLGHLQNGIYVISITDGTKKSVRRIIKK